MVSTQSLLDRIYADKNYALRIASDIFEISINYQQGIFLSRMVDRYRPKRVVELGFRYGISSLWIQNARHSPISHNIIDPYHHIPTPPRSLVIYDYIKKQKGVIFEERYASQEYLAAMYVAHKKVDMVFMDASQWFDSVMTDMFFVSRILNVQGIVIIRNIYNRPVRKAIMFYLRNLPYSIEGISLWKNWVVKRVPVIGELLLRSIQRPVGLCVLRLTGEDKRATQGLWRHFVSF